MRLRMASNSNEKRNAKPYIEWKIYTQPKPTGLQSSYQKGYTKDIVPCCAMLFSMY